MVCVHFHHTSNTVTIRVSKELAAWLEDTAANHRPAINERTNPSLKSKQSPLLELENAHLRPRKFCCFEPSPLLLLAG